LSLLLEHNNVNKFASLVEPNKTEKNEEGII